MSFGDIILIALAMIVLVPLVQMIIIPLIGLTAIGVYSIYNHIRNEFKGDDYIPRDKNQ